MEDGRWHGSYKDDLGAEAPRAAGTGIPAAGITEPQEGRVGRRTWLGTAVMLVAVFMELMDVTMANVAVPSIHKDLGASFAQAQWVVAGYSLAFAAALMTGGRIGDIWGCPGELGPGYTSARLPRFA
jgi:hypothetical protein